MIYFESVQFKNFLSTGDAWTKIDLDASKSTLIVGENGAGKSTMLDAITFALYGKPFRKINKPQLINSINQKGALVELVLRIGSDRFLIRRGIKPNVFEVLKNGTLVNQDAAARDYQAYLDDTVVKMSFKSFGQVVVLGSSTFVPFMQLSAAHRREVIEDLLDIQIFTTMNTLLKQKVSDNKEDIYDSKRSIELSISKIDSAISHNESIRKLKETEVYKLKAKLGDQISYITAEQQSLDTLMEQSCALAETVSDKLVVAGKIQAHREMDNSLSSTQRNHSKNIEFFTDHDNCPTCKQGIDETFRDDTIGKSNTKVTAIDDARSKLAKSLSKYLDRQREISDVESQILNINLEMGTHRANIKLSMDLCKQIKRELEGAQKGVESIDTADINRLQDEINHLNKVQDELFKDRETFNVVGAVLKDGGVKTSMIRRYIPVMNTLINQYLAAMELFVQFELDDGFNETIKSRHRDVFSYGSFSEGEKLRIDLALMFTWRAISKKRNSISTNLLIMDEIMDSSLDDAGTEEFMRIVNELTTDSNVFIISHKGDQISDKFERVIKLEKHKNFSRIVE